jgi:hypothetical protein
MSADKKVPFQYSIRHLASDILAIEYVGYMDEADGAVLKETAGLVDGSAVPVGIMYTVPQFTGFHRANIMGHVELFMPRLDKSIRGVAVLGAKTAIHFAAISVSLMSRMPLRSFYTEDEALSWLRSLGQRVTRQTT